MSEKKKPIIWRGANLGRYSVQFSSIQLLSRVWLFATPWTTVGQASLSITNSQSPSKPMSIESGMPSNHLILCCPLLCLPSLFPSIRVFSNESALDSTCGQDIGVSASTSVLAMNAQDWSPLGWTGWISLQSSGETLEYLIYLCCMLCSVSHDWLFVTPWTVAHQALLSMGFSGKNPGVHNHFLLQRIFPTQGMKLCLPYLLHCRRILYCQATGEAHPNLCSSKSVITS